MSTPTFESPGSASGDGVRLRRIGTVAVVLGGAVSTGLMWWVGRRNPSLLLMGLFTGWVLAPFVGLLLIAAAARRWSGRARRVLYCVMLAIAVASVAVYADVMVRPPASTPAFRFLVTPMASWLVVAATCLAVGRVGRGRLRSS